MVTEAGFLPDNDNLPAVRRFEAVGFRAWPATSVVYDGSWQVRLTGGHPSRRLNSVVPLDPGDVRDIDIRLEKARKRFEAYGRPLTVRETPLAPPQLIAALREKGWSRIEETAVLSADLTAMALPAGMDYLPTQDIGRFVDAYIVAEGAAQSLKPALAEILDGIKPATGLFVLEDPVKGPLATVLCVQDNDLAGILLLTVSAEERRKGLGTEILAAALRWARMRGAKTAWLQVGAANAAALALYHKLGFSEAYRYCYWREEKGA